MSEFVLPLRGIHLDFHTGPWVPDVSRDFAPKEFARAFKEAHVDSVTVFAKCHHGHLYYQTDHPARHPSLPKDLDLLGEQIRALHEVGIRAPIYISVQCDEFAANQHPDWIVLDANGKQVGRGTRLTAGWQILDMSSPYQDYLAEQVQEVLACFAPVDGIFLDMCWDQPSLSKWAIQGMERKALDPREEADRRRYARQLVHEYMARFKAMVDAAHDPAKPVGIWFNSRPKVNLHEEKKYLRHIEIEALPTGGWGYDYFPYVARFVRPLGLPTLSHTGRFFKSWGDNGGLKPEMALKYECCQILSQGIAVAVGDLLPPRGLPSKAVYELIGRVYSRIEECQAYVNGGQLLSQIALVVDQELGDSPGPSAIGATRALRQLRQQFDIVPPEGDLEGYEVVIVPETTKIDAALEAKLRKHLSAGGSLLVSGPAAVDDSGNPVMPELGIRVEGRSPYSHVFLHAGASVSKGLADYGYVMYEPGYRLLPADGAEALVEVGEPYFERAYNHFSGHDYTPEGKRSPYAGAVKCGKAITFAVPILEAYGKHGAPNYRVLLGNCLDRLLPEPLVRAEAPSALETTVVRKDGRTIVHLLSFSPERRAQNLDVVEDAFPLVDIPLAVKLAAKPKRAFLVPQQEEVAVDYRDGYAHVRVSVRDGHAMLVFE